MTIARHYVMTSKDSHIDILRQALLDLATKVRRVGGCEGVTLFVDTALPNRFIFIEYWSSVASHKEGGRQLGKEALAPVMAALDAPPEAAYLERIAP